MTKKSILIHKDSLSILDELTFEEAGKLFKMIYHNQCKKEELDLGREMRLIFIPFKNQFIRDDEKYIEKCDKARDSVNKRWNKNNTNEYERIQTNTNHTDNKNKKDNKKDNKNKSTDKKEEFILSCDALLQEPLRLWLKYRSDLKKKEQWEFQLNKMKSMSDPMDAVKQSRGNGWKGLFERKDAAIDDYDKILEEREKDRKKMDEAFEKYEREKEGVKNEQ